ncbi:MAG: hypothetical protein LBE05_05105 [Microbacterium sp.]|jgi:hypothetical protein|nr:hypothetical protein [Microbacterium sp.]
MTTVLLRLDHDRPALWRDPRTLQLGLYAEPALPDPPGWQERVLRALEDGIAEEEFARAAQGLGAPLDELDAFLHRIRPALRRVDTDLLMPRIQVAPELRGRDVVDVVIAGLSALPGLSHEDFRGRAPVILLSAHAVLPRAAAPWMADDVVHVPLVLELDAVRVGPAVLPGITACTSCFALAERDADPAWPHLIAQLAEREPPVPDPVVLGEAIGLARALLPLAGAAAAGRGGAGLRLTEGPSRSVSLRSGNRRLWRTHRPHEDCGCRSPAGTATASA